MYYEEKLLAKAIKPISIKETELILGQMKNCVCKIKAGPKKGTGFFIKIPYRNQLLNVLMTNNHVLGEEDILDDNYISIFLNNENETKNIKMDSKRKRYTNEILDVTIIELLEKDNIRNFLDLDTQIKERINLIGDDNSIGYFNNLYKKESIYLLNYILNSTEEIYASYGLLEKIEGNEISHKCNTGYGSSGSPILLLKTKTVIGIHYHGGKECNFGILLIRPLIEFQQIYNNFVAIRKNISTNINYNINLNKIYNDLKNYFIGETDIVNKLNNKINPKQSYQGFLVEKIWVDKWKKLSNYDFIKLNYLDKNINNENKIKKLILDNLTNGNLNYDEINNVENYIIKDINHLKLPANLNKSYILLNSNFLRAFPFKANILSTNFYLSYQNIQIYSKNIPIYSFETNNNIIININQPLKHTEYNSEYIKQLLKYAFFKKDLHSQYNLYKTFICQAYIINSEIINKLKQIFKLKELIINLENNQILAGITYQNFDANYSRILKYINNFQINYINSIKKYEEKEAINFNENEISPIPKDLNNYIDIKYFDGFDIIGEQFATFLKKKFNNITIPLIYFVIIQDKLYANIFHGQKNYYQIMDLNSNHNLNFEYIIEITKNRLFNDTKSLNYYFFYIFAKKGIQNLFYQENPISLENDNFIFNLYNRTSMHRKKRIKKIENTSIPLIMPNSTLADSLSINSYSEIQNEKNNKVHFIFITTTQLKFEIFIEKDKTIDELIKLYFEKIKHPELYGDSSIGFLYNANALKKDSKILIRDFFEKGEIHCIIVFGLDDKIDDKLL